MKNDLKVDSLRAKLRCACLKAHENLEAQPRLKRLLDPNLSETDYLDVLLRFQAGFRELNRFLWSALSDSDRFCHYIDQSCRLDALQEDLIRISENHQSPAVDRFIATPSFSQGLGVLYVVMGSTLGGQVIHQALTRSESKKIRCAGHFFSGCQSDRALRWKSFLDDLESSDVPLGQVEEIALGADRTFNYMLRVFE